MRGGGTWPVPLTSHPPLTHHAVNGGRGNTSGQSTGPSNHINSLFFDCDPRVQLSGSNYAVRPTMTGTRVRVARVIGSGGLILINGKNYAGLN